MPPRRSVELTTATLSQGFGIWPHYTNWPRPSPDTLLAYCFPAFVTRFSRSNWPSDQVAKIRLYACGACAAPCIMSVQSPEELQANLDEYRGQLEQACRSSLCLVVSSSALQTDNLCLGAGRRTIDPGSRQCRISRPAHKFA